MRVSATQADWWREESWYCEMLGQLEVQMIVAWDFTYANRSSRADVLLVCMVCIMYLGSDCMSV